MLLKLSEIEHEAILPVAIDNPIVHRGDHISFQAAIVSNDNNIFLSMKNISKIDSNNIINSFQSEVFGKNFN